MTRLTKENVLNDLWEMVNDEATPGYVKVKGLQLLLEHLPAHEADNRFLHLDGFSKIEELAKHRHARSG